MKIKCLIPFVLILSMSKGECLVGEENLALFEIASNTAMQLNELEQLLTTTQKYTERMMQMNDYANETINFTKRTELWMQDMSYLIDQKDVHSIGELNSYIRDIKYNREELKDIVSNLYIEKHETEKSQRKSQKISIDSGKRLDNYKKDTKITNLKDQPKVLGKIASNTHNIMAETAVTNATLGKQVVATEGIKTTIINQNLDAIKKENEEENNSKEFFSKGIKKRINR